MTTPLILTLLISNRRVQKHIVNYAIEVASDALGTDVRIREVAYKLPASIEVGGIYVEDTDNDTLAYIGSVTARLSIRALLSKQIAIKDVGIDSITFHLKTDSTGVTNLQFIIDALADTTKKAEPIDIIFAAPDVKLTHSRFLFDNTSIPARTDTLFDAAHIVVNDINLNATLEYATTDSVKAVLDDFSCREKSGLSIENLNCTYKLGKHGMAIESLIIDMPHTNVNLPVASVSYDSIAQLNHLKQFLEHSELRVFIKPSFLSGKDFACFMPGLNGLRNDIKISTDIQYRDGVLDLTYLNTTYGTGTSASLRGSIEGIVAAFADSIDIDNIKAYVDVYNVATNRADVENTISDLLGKPFRMPQEIRGLSRLGYKGTISGSPSEARYVGRFTTNAGDIQTNASGGYSGRSGVAVIDGNIKMQDFDLSKIMTNDTLLGKVTVDINCSGTYNKNTNRVAVSASGRIDRFEFNHYTYSGLSIDGLYNPELAVAEITFNDAQGNGTMSLDAMFDNRCEDKSLTVELHADTIKTGGMNLTPTLPTFNITTDLYVDAHFKDIDNMEGYIYIDSTMIANEGMVYPLDYMHIDVTNDAVLVTSPILKANIYGEYTPSTFLNNIKYIVGRELDNIKPMQTTKLKSSNNFTFNATVQPLNDIANLFGSTNTIDDTTHIEGFFNDYTDELSVKLFSNDIILGNNTIDSVVVVVDNAGEKVNVQTDLIYQTFLDTTYWGITAGLYHNIADVDINFWNTIESDFSGDISLTTEFFKPKHSDATIELLATLHNSDLVLGDSLWHIKQGSVFFDEHEIAVDSLAFEGTDQYLRIAGRANNDVKGAMIGVDMKGVDLYYLSNVFYMPDIKLLGIATGKVRIANALGKAPILDADVYVDGFGLNGYAIADAHGIAKFNNDNKRIELFAEVLNEKKDTSYLHGYVAPVENEMLLDIDINELHLKFIEQYLVSFSHEMDGIARGKLYVGGPLDKIELWGDAYVHDAKLGIDYLNSTFHFADSVHIKKDKFIFKDIELTDDNGNKGLIDGLVTHHLFQNFKYQIDFSIDKFRVLNTTAAEFPDFYGTVFASGKAKIVGDESKVDIAVVAKPEAGSYFAVPLDNYRTASDNQFITFVKKDTLKRSSFERGRKRFIESAPMAKLNVDIAIDATPNVEAQIIMDSHSGDIIRAKGNGNIKVQVDQNANVKLYGKYEITEGDYNFSMQGAIRKKFEVGENSSISFDGDPMNGILDIKAKYPTTASLTDLLEEGMLSDINNTNVKVNCLAYIRGNLLQPQIKFDVELPNAEDEIVRRVKATINTDDMMIQQMVFLLAFGKFYNSQLTTQSSSASSYATSFVTSSVSSQLNYWMSQISNNVNLGFNYNDSQKDAYNNYSVAVNVSTNLFNNRLVLYGNFGYQRQKNGQENVIGDFDAEYKLTKSGRFRLKAYNKTNDITYSTSLYTQGLGIMYKETFDTWKNLGETYKELTRKKSEAEKAAAKAQKEKEKAEKAKRKAAKKALREDRKRRHKEYVAQQKALKAAKKNKSTVE